MLGRMNEMRQRRRSRTGGTSSMSVAAAAATGLSEDETVATASSSKPPSTAQPDNESSTLLQTPEPRRRRRLLMDSQDSSMGSATLDALDDTTPTSRTAAPMMMGAEQVKKDESRWTKIGVRVGIGCSLFAFFCATVYAGHLYVCLVVAAVETLLFYELVRVRYSAYFDTVKDNTIPLFRTTQWMWFAVALFYTYGDFVSEVITNNLHYWQLHWLSYIVQYTSSISFCLYSTTLMVTIATLQREHLRFQINQLCWTIVVLCLTLGQLKYIMHNVYNGLFWYVFPSCLVFCNDVMAYVCGMTLGRKFVRRPFLSFSPNKTWEGFVGAAFFTLVAAWYFSKFLARFTWMTCPATEFSVWPKTLHCDPDPVFVRSQWIFPSQLLDVPPRNLVRMIPGVVQICSTPLLESTTTTAATASLDNSGAGAEEEWTPVLHADGTPAYQLDPCVSGHEWQAHHHFELKVTKDFYPVQVHALWLALFASVVAPFGGFLASAIKRAYGLKNFAALIPGHGGVMDRFDCQLLMALCTWVYYNTFIKIATLSVTKLSYLYSLLPPAEQAEFLKLVTKQAGQ